MSLQQIITTFIPQGIYIVTSKYENKINGLTAAWVGQVSFNPKLLSVALTPTRYTYELIKKSHLFCINTLSKDQIQLAKNFGFVSGRQKNKFEGVDYFFAKHGCPVIKDALAYFECQLVKECEAGDHIILIGEIKDYKVLNPLGKPLIFRWEDFF